MSELPVNIKDYKDEELLNLINNLITDEVCESKTIEYKEKSKFSDVGKFNSLKDKNEFLADISSFANTSGGDILYGITELKCLPKKMVGIDISNFDQLKLNLLNIIGSHLEPNLSGLDFYHVPLKNSKVEILIIRIPKSWASPHMNKDTCKFHARHSAGKYTLDVFELKNQFLLSETLTQKIRSFRYDRISSCNADEMPVVMEQGAAKIVLHIIPFSAFDINILEQYDLSKVEKQGLKILNSQNGVSPEYNFYGLFSYNRPINNFKTSSYTQFFRNGIIEAVDTKLSKGSSDVYSLYEKHVVCYISYYLKLFKTIGVEPPIITALSLLNVKDYFLFKDYNIIIGDYFKGNPITQKDLIMPEVLIESFDADIPQLMKPAFDMVWNACGESGSLNYLDGKWIHDCSK
ncbi:MAG: ATP-binding protein [Nitrospirae bacterium]|nr:ATP-binding protein [Nitrospirota bacterium]MBF0542696.1 ATP-binding protein [Nitrospirota bacterium]